MTDPNIANAEDLAQLRAELLDDIGVYSRGSGTLTAERARELVTRYFEVWLEDYDAEHAAECEPDSPFDDCRIADDIEDRHAARGER